jgi:hypothetical protein
MPNLTCEQLLAAEVQNIFPGAAVTATLNETGEHAFVTVDDTTYFYDMAADEDETSTFRFCSLDAPQDRTQDIRIPMPAGWLEAFADQF